mmetsp:Transcript_1515/g.4314  ORF Transcript_1515/g.4314 Transcript_1515/m.4314 type:complete len:122 (-) Transcript_1515:194-559(-)
MMKKVAADVSFSCVFVCVFYSLSSPLCRYAFYEEIALPAPMYRLWNTVVVGYLSPALQPYYAPPEVMNITIVTDFEDQGWTKKQDLGGGDGAIYRSVPVFMSFTSEEDKDKWMEAIANFDV